MLYSAAQRLHDRSASARVALFSAPPKHEPTLSQCPSPPGGTGCSNQTEEEFGRLQFDTRLLPNKPPIIGSGSTRRKPASG